MRRIAVMSFCVTHERELQVVDEGVVPLEQRAVHFDALADTRIRKIVRHAVAIGRVREAPLEFRDVVRSYAKWFGVDLMCALRELQALGVRLEPSYVAAIKRTFELRPSDKASRTAQAEAHLEELGSVRDEDFAYIAGRTGDGAAFGITTTEASEFEDSTFQARDDKAGAG